MTYLLFLGIFLLLGGLYGLLLEGAFFAGLLLCALGAGALYVRRFLRKQRYHHTPSSPGKKPEPVLAPQPGDHFLVNLGRGKNVHYPTISHATAELCWVSQKDCNQHRIPAETSRTYSRSAPFQAAGVTYPSLHQLFDRSSPDRTLSRDYRGRQVLCLRERFPCFDSCDYLHENRFYHWIFLVEGSKLTRIWCADDCDKIVVTEDVRYLDDNCWSAFQELGFFTFPRS